MGRFLALWHLDLDLLLTLLLTEQYKGLSEYWEIFCNYLFNLTPVGIPIPMCCLDTKSGDAFPFDSRMGRLNCIAQASRCLSDDL